MQQACAQLEDLTVYKVLPRYPARYEASRVLNTFDPNVIFLEMGDFESALELAREIRATHPRTTIIGYGPRCSRERTLEAAEAGVQSVLAVPFLIEDLQQSVLSVLEAQSVGVPENLVAFVPAKGGSGASTVALNVAGSLAREWNQKVLVIDADLHSGVLSVLLNLSEPRPVADALERSSQLNEELWLEMRSQACGLDLLAAPAPQRRAGFSQLTYHQFLSFVRSRYDAVIADLGEASDELGEAVASRARSVYVVCTPEPPSLALARRQISGLKAMGVPSSRIDIVLNRRLKDDPKVEDIERMLERRVAAVLPSDFASVRRATLDGHLVDQTSDLGKAFSLLAGTLAGPGATPAPPEDSRSSSTFGFLFRKRAAQQA